MFKHSSVATTEAPTVGATSTPTPAPGADQHGHATAATSVGDLPVDLAGLVGEVMGPLGEIFASMQEAEESIAAAQLRHPAHADRIWHAFSLLLPTHERMSTAFVYRSHCAELLDRLAAGEDTRPGTAAEVCCAMLETSLLAPLRSTAFGLYLRMWNAAGFPDIDEFAASREHHEALDSSVIDEHEQFARRKLAVPDRRLAEIVCDGRHHGASLACAYAQPEQLTLTSLCTPT